MQSDKVRDTSIKGLLMKMYEHNFVELQLQHCVKKISINYDELSRNDGRFLDLMDQKAVKVDGHYKLPLPLKDEDIQLPNNRAAAMKRLESLRRKFERDDRFFKEYKNFMEELTEKEYARKCDCKGSVAVVDRYFPQCIVATARRRNCSEEMNAHFVICYFRIQITLIPPQES